jgi:cytochrome b
MSTTNEHTATSVKVWDFPVRIIHWGLALSVFGAWLTRELEGDWFAWHTRCGYAVLVLVLTRIVWGLIGTRYARFADFVRGPLVVAKYIKEISRSSGDSRYLGHNPLGALMIIALLTMLLMQAVTGLFANDQIFETGPLFGYVSVAVSDQLTTWHKQIFDLLWIAILVHIAAALFYLWVLGQNLILPLLTGRKSGAADQGIRSSRTAWAVLIALVIGAALWVLVRTAPEAFLFDF